MKRSKKITIGIIIFFTVIAIIVIVSSETVFTMLIDLSITSDKYNILFFLQ